MVDLKVAVEVGMPMIAYFVAKDMAAYIEALNREQGGTLILFEKTL